MESGGPKAQRLKGPKAQKLKSPKVQRLKSPKVQRLKSPKVQRLKSPKAQKPKGPKAQRAKSPKAQNTKTIKDMNKEPIFISFANQKGGIGKSTLTVLAASWLRYIRGLNVLVVDCDFPQNSIYELREREKKAVVKNDAYKLQLQRQFERLQKKAYPIIRATPENAEKNMQVFLDSEPEPYDVVLFDLPGTMNTKGILYTVSRLNYLFIPMRADRLVMQSTLNFAQTMYDKFVGNPATDIKDAFLFWNMEDRREKTGIYDLYEQILSSFNMKIYTSRIQMRSKFSRELADTDGMVYRSTLFRSDGTFLRESGMAALMDEICTSIGI